MNTRELTTTAHIRLVNTLQTRKNVLSIPHEKALYSLVESFMKMGGGTLTGRWAFPIPTGCGKTTAIVECCAALHHAGNTALSAVVCASRIEALCTMKRDLLPAKQEYQRTKIGLIYAGVKADKYSEPCTTENERRPLPVSSGRSLMLSADQQAAFEAMILDVVQRVKARQFTSNRDLSTFFHRTESWAPHIKTLIVKSGLMSAVDWSQSFTKRGNPHSRMTRCTMCSHSFSTLKEKSNAC